MNELRNELVTERATFGYQRKQVYLTFDEMNRRAGELFSTMADASPVNPIDMYEYELLRYALIGSKNPANNLGEGRLV